MKARSLTIARSIQNFNLGSAFAAFIYPVIAVIVLSIVLTTVGVTPSLELSWWYIPLGVFTATLTIFICNVGIGPLHRILQHKAGELNPTGQVMTMLTLFIAMQGSVREWVNYHSQHHRFADQPGDPHNPSEGKFWAWVGWIIWRDEKDAQRPLAMWLKKQPIIAWMDRFHQVLTVGIHLLVPILIYTVVWLLGGSLVLTVILHACFVFGRTIQFHATVYGINVLGHLKTPLWADYAMATLTGGEAFHDHHHEAPQSALHLPRKGFWNRVFDYNGTILLVYEKLGLVKNLKIAPQFA